MPEKIEKQTREAIIADLKEVLEESKALGEHIFSIQAAYPDSLGDLRPALDALIAFQKEVKRYVDDLYVM